MNIRNRLDTFLTPWFSKKNKLFTESKVFCMSPWIQLHAQTSGKVSPCCMSSVNNGNEIGDLRQNPNLSDSWNSPNMRQLRQDMLTGKKNSLCTNCYKFEELGKFSERMQYNQDFRHYYDRVVSTLKDGTLPDKTVPIIDIRFSNKCNYKCRICNSDYSTLWYEEELKLGKHHNGQPKEIKAAENEEVFWQSFKNLLPYVKRLHFAGGEPLFMDEHYEVLNHLMAIGKTDVNLTYNTNLSTLRYKQNHVVDLWKNFKQVDVWASLDGMGERGDYQRKGQKWVDIEANIRTIQKEAPAVFLGINITVSAFNILHIPDFYRHLVDNKFIAPDRVNLYPLFYPHHFAITNLTPTIKEKVRKSFVDFDTQYLSKLANADKIRSHIKAMITLMDSGQQAEQKQFRDSINAVDSIRGENFKSVFPELEELMIE